MPILQKKVEPQKTACYKDFTELCKQVNGLRSCSAWPCRELSERLVLKKMLKPFLLPEMEIVEDDGLGFTVKVSVRMFFFFFFYQKIIPYI